MRLARLDCDAGGLVVVATRLLDAPEHATAFGFRVTTFGTILGRSISVPDLQLLLTSCPTNASLEDYRAAVVDENILRKPTASACRFAFRNLTEFYGLDRKILIFRALRDLWEADPLAQPLLALLCACARDPILRALTHFVLDRDRGQAITPEEISTEAERLFPSKFGESTRPSLGRNAAASWQQAGLLSGRNQKERSQATSRPASVAYALLLGDLCGERGARLFETQWARALDASAHLLREQAAEASRQGWIEYRASGDVTEISFRHLMREEEAA